MTFRPYYAYVRVKYNNNKNDVETEIEKCYIDTPNTWCKESKEAIEKQNKQRNLS